MLYCSVAASVSKAFVIVPKFVHVLAEPHGRGGQRTWVELGPHWVESFSAQNWVKLCRFDPVRFSSAILSVRLTHWAELGHNRWAELNRYWASHLGRTESLLGRPGTTHHRHTTHVRRSATSPPLSHTLRKRRDADLHAVFRAHIS